MGYYLICIEMYWWQCVQWILLLQVKGFSVDGRVLASPSGKPLEGAIIMINQKVMTKTGADGIFHLDSMTPGVYELLVQASKSFKKYNNLL